MDRSIIIQYIFKGMDWRECGRCDNNDHQITFKLRETLRSMSSAVGSKNAQSLRVRAIGADSKRLYDIL